MRKADKLFQLTNLVRARQPITADEISVELGVSVRTVYRYIDDLSVSGIPIYGTTGVGYQLDEQFELPPLNLTENEFDALMLGVKMVCGWTGDTLSASAKSLSVKIESVVPHILKEKHLNHTHVPDIMERSNERKTWEIVHASIKDKVALRLIYTSLANKQTTREVYPLGLFYWGGKWTVGCWCTLRSDYRDFRLDKIDSLKILMEFKETSNVNYESYVASFKSSNQF
ncbi:hypothetical protein MNBD_GAMMA05-1092 [hydrothermal vent metagenome]|uniref:Transcriptional regulator, DeoR family n=1 Tax=hydrothermal vent metagenome TaxID=652676 RepID=A0A3B0W976_9ZZZZ